MTAATRNFRSSQKPAATSSRDFRSFLLMAQFEAREIGARIKQARKEAGMTQDDLSAVASFSVRSLQDYENGVTIPYKHLREIGRTLGKEPNWFLHGDQEDDATPADVDALRQAVREELAGVLEVMQSIEDRLARVERRSG